jgi:integrase
MVERDASSSFAQISGWLKDKTRLRDDLHNESVSTVALGLMFQYRAHDLPLIAETLILVTSLDHLHAKVARPIVKGKRVYRFSKEFVLHSLRHTMLTRLGEAGAEAFTIMKIAGHSSVTVSQRYVHPTTEAVERAFQRLETLNAHAGLLPMPEREIRQLPATVSATLDSEVAVSC